MLLSSIRTTFVICILVINCNASTETDELLSIRSQLAELKAEQNRMRKLHNNFCSYDVETHSDCTEATAKSQSSGIYEIHVPSYSEQPFKVACDAKTQGGGWTIILNRMDGSVDFNRNWNSFKNGFGDLEGEFFLGLDKIYALTTESNQELIFVLENIVGTQMYEIYDKFAIGNEEQEYILHTLGRPTGNASDAFSYNHRQRFATYDRDTSGKCAEKETGAWWHLGCTAVNLFATYNGTLGKEMFWAYFRNIPLKRAVMMIRPRLSS